jgi:proteic killer suppression protein
LRISNFIIIFAAETIINMIVTFEEEYLENLYKKGETGVKKYRFQPQVVRGYQKGVKYLIQAQRKEDLFPFKSLHFEALRGDKEGRFSIKANDQYRIEFTLTETDDEPVVTICNIMELSNHYK